MSIEALAGALTSIEGQQGIVAGNLANRTPGHKEMTAATEVSKDFSTYMQPKLVTSTNFTRGSVKTTGNATDLVVLNTDVDGKEQTTFFSLDGGSVYSHCSEYRWAGDVLVNADGKVLDGAGGPITRNGSGGPVSIASDGNVYQDGQTIGQVKAVTFENLDDLKPVPGGFELAGEGAAMDVANARFAPGCTEDSNGNNVKLMTDQIRLSQSYNSTGSMIRTLDELYARASQYANSS